MNLRFYKQWLSQSWKLLTSVICTMELWQAYMCDGFLRHPVLWLYMWSFVSIRSINESWGNKSRLVCPPEREGISDALQPKSISLYWKHCVTVRRLDNNQSWQSAGARACQNITFTASVHGPAKTVQGLLWTLQRKIYNINWKRIC